MSEIGEEARYGVSYVADKPENIKFDGLIDQDLSYNVRVFRKIAREMTNTYARKNHDYGDAYTSV